MSFTRLIFEWEGIKSDFYTIGEGETLIFLPGWSAAFLTYLPLITILSTKYKVIVLELPGFSRVKHPPKLWNFQDYADFVSAFIDLYPQEKVILSGHSFGAAVTLYTAAKNKKIEKIVLFDAAGMPIEYDRLKFFSKYLKELLFDILNPKHFSSLKSIIKVISQSAKNYRYQIQLAFYVFSKKIETDEAIYTSITVPSVIFWGSNDLVFTNKIAEELNSKLKGEKVTYVDGNHNWTVFNPEVIKEHLDLI